MKYLRDGRSPIPKSEVTSKVMSANKGKDTGPELTLRKILRENGLSGYRLNWKKAPGRPDIVYPGHKLAIFVHGCFWHRCPHCNLSYPKSHTDFWKKKFKRNKERDARKLKELKEKDWRVIIVWECEIRKNIDNVLKKIIKARGEAG